MAARYGDAVITAPPSHPLGLRAAGGSLFDDGCRFFFGVAREMRRGECAARESLLTSMLVHAHTPRERHRSQYTRAEETTGAAVEILLSPMRV
ncbi:hypothetical protein HPB50_010711 [Hyalomma asiaticum]|uniref:Uncharacterized protein n=1 Tax=Hyalomma asiaticum TaxID=266040 RepID=A0ACB7SEG3_HYAAI|nr:hypothetical protein HPB50_010711 [Hyalomma asiaticum]